MVGADRLFLRLRAGTPAIAKRAGSLKLHDDPLPIGLTPPTACLAGLENRLAVYGTHDLRNRLEAPQIKPGKASPPLQIVEPFAPNHLRFTQRSRIVEAIREKYLFFQWD